MAKAFLDIIKSELGDLYEGDEFGGARGSDGSGLPLPSPRNFMFATGIECSYPTIEHGKLRRDELEECGHYEHWREDIGLVRELGLKYLRYGLPYYRINTARGQYDWSFADEVMAEMQKQKITPILDLMHFGVPDWIENYQNPELPVLFAEYADAVAERYPWVRYYTPINELYVTAKFSAKEGIWNEQRKDDKSFVTAVKHLVAANILAAHKIVRRRHNVVFVQSESAEYVHACLSTDGEPIELDNKLRFLALDLLYAHAPDADVCMYLLDNGLTRQEYDWFMAGEPPGYHVVGMDYYGGNEQVIIPDGTRVKSEDILGWYQISRQYYTRYHKPLMHTETNLPDPERAPTWLWKQWVNILQMRSEGVPVLGFTWYSLHDQIDWDIALREKKGTINPSGLYDLERKRRPVGDAYRSLLESNGQIPLLPHGQLFELTEEDATLKTDV